ncbi:hypothetical protein [Delftia deserti]|uniref:Uncharacterized protein n=1 Tax=Delftia deserti TaxID=1651218 RepID=A0ABW5EY09_9BURK
MAIEPAATLTPIPEFPALSDRAAGTYNSKAYNFGTHMGGPGPFVGEINALAANVQHNAQEAQSAAGGSGDAQAAAEEARDEAVQAQSAAEDARDASVTAKGQAEAARDASITAKGQSEAARDASQTARGGSESARDASVAAKGQSEAARDAAQGFRNQAEVFATQQIKGSSTTSVTPGAGAKSFVIEASRSFVVGMYVVATSTSDPATSMSGYIQSYNPSTGALVIGVDMFAGASAKADWVIGVAAPGAASGLTRQVVTANTTCVAGVAYIVAAAGITLTLPTSWTPGDKIAFIEAIGNGAIYSVAWGSTLLRGRAMGTRQISAIYGGSNGTLTYQDATRGLV